MTKYTVMQLEEYDKAFKIDNKQILCYSKKTFKSLDDEPKIIGEVNDYDNDEDAETSIVVGKKTFAVCEPGKTSRLLYSCRGYVEVRENEYIAFYKNRLPFLFWLLGIITAAILLLWLILWLGTAPEELPNHDKLHPLPPVDSNVETMSGDETGTPAADDEHGGSVTMTLSPTATLTLSTGTIDMFFMNPRESTHDVLIELYVVSTESGTEEEYKIAESGRIPIGSKLSVLTLSADPELFAGEGKYMARYYVKCYDPDTGEKVIIDPSFNEINLIVQN